MFSKDTTSRNVEGKVKSFDKITSTWELDQSCSEQLCKTDKIILLRSPNFHMMSLNENKLGDPIFMAKANFRIENVTYADGSINLQKIKLILNSSFKIPHYSVTVVNKKYNEIISSHEFDGANGDDGCKGIVLKRNLIINEKLCNLLGDKLIIFFHLTICKDTMGAYKKDNLRTEDSLSCNLTRRLKELDYLEDILNDEKFSDVTLKVNDQVSFYAHKSILSRRSPVFEAMFCHEMKEKITNVVEINDVDPQSFEEMLRFIYTGKVNEIDKHVDNLLTLADMYSIKGLKSLCAEVIIDCKITTGNALMYLRIADNCNAEELTDNIIRFMVEHRRHMLKTPEYEAGVQNLPGKLVFKLLKALSL